MCTVRVIEADTDAPKPFLVTEYADGPSLSEYVDANGPLDPAMLYGLATGLAEALAAIHAAGIVHRDLKPSNVLLTAGGPKVIDFGIAQALDTTSMTRTGITVGSAGFMAPEQIMGRAGTAADVFTWAVTVTFAAGGRAPFGPGRPTRSCTGSCTPRPTSARCRRTCARWSRRPWPRTRRPGPPRRSYWAS